jgi:hypothetical protein
MNIPLLNFCLFLLWFGVALTVLLIGPLTYPDTFKDLRFVGLGASLLAFWNLFKWWLVRHNARARAYRQEMEDAYRQRINPPEEKKEKQIVCPEFQFDDDAKTRIAPPNEEGNGE